MAEVVGSIFLFIGAVFMLLAAVGITRMPDLFTRMQTTSKASTLGILCMLLGVGIYFWDVSIAMRALTVIVFAFLTVPIGAHMIGRAAYLQGVHLWDRTVIDELKGKYNPTTHDLQSDGTPGNT